MRIRALPLLALLAAAASAGCSVYSVQSRQSGQVRPEPGIPFFSLATACRQQTVRVQPFLRVRLTIDSIVRDARGIETRRVALVTDERLVPRSSATLAAVQRAAAQPLRADFRTLAAGPLAALAPHQADAVGPGGTIAANHTESVRFVDYSRPYYVNVSRPLIGSANTQFTLDSLGLLSQAKADVADSTLGKVLDVLPVKEFFTSALGLGGSATAHGGALSLYEQTVAVESVTYVDTWTKNHPATSLPCASNAPITPNDLADYRRQVVEGDALATAARAAAASDTGKAKR